ncbi:FRG domain-containing protein [Candidatus Enterococcus lemimoniae]|uniref:FRG domain-containing protein n=1 Tax=Candidatus Enterococcus lemimoniae TaxID=1834167 RepID=A0ABZ2T9W5_9ENTE
MLEKSKKKGIIDYLNEVNNTIRDLKKHISGFSNGECVLAYRGEPMDYGETSLMPSIFREKYTLKDELNLLDLICDYEIVDKVNLKNIEKAIESQHYIAISRLLDITFNILPAIYFACSQREDKDGKIYIFAFPEYFSPQSNYIENFYSSLLDEKSFNSPFFGDFKVITHGYNNERMKLQSGGFILFPGQKYRKIPKCYYKEIYIDKKDKQLILDELSAFFNISEASIYPEKDKRASLIREKVKRIQSIKRYDTEITVDLEVRAYLDRLTFEMALRKEKNEDTKKITRIFRKEIADLIYYIDNSGIGNGDSDKKNKVNLKNECESTFNFYKKVIRKGGK